MLISRAMLRQGLEGLVSLPKNAYSGTEFVLKSPRFIDNFTTLEENRIYLSTVSLTPEGQPLPNGCIVFLPYSGTPVSYNIHIHHLPSGVSVSDVFNRILATFERWGRFREDLSDMVEQRKSVEELLSLGSRELGNPIYLHNHQYELLASGGAPVQPRPERSAQVIRALNNDPVYRSLQNADSFFSIPASFAEFSFLCCNSWSDKEHFDYRIVLAGVRSPISAADESVFRLLCNFIQRTMRLPSEQSRLFPGSADTEQLRRIFSDALGRSDPDYLRLAQELAPYGWLAEHEFCVLAIQMPQSESELHSAALLSQQLEQRFPHSATVTDDNRILLIVNLSRNDKGIDQLLHSAVYFLRDNFLKVGISNPAARLRQLHSCCIQAKIALEHILSGNSYAWRIHFRDVALSYILSNCSGQLSPRAVCSGKLLQLQQYDADHNTELYRTLRCYIESHFNALEVTRTLFIHRSTFLYRLERAKSLFDIDLDDPDELLHIMISIRLLEQETES